MHARDENITNVIFSSLAYITEQSRTHASFTLHVLSTSKTNEQKIRSCSFNIQNRNIQKNLNKKHKTYSDSPHSYVIIQKFIISKDKVWSAFLSRQLLFCRSIFFTHDVAAGNCVIKCGNIVLYNTFASGRFSRRHFII